MKLKVTSMLSLSVLGIATLFFTSSCKKDNNNSSPAAGVTATISGKSFTSALASGFYYQGVGYGGFEIIGYKVTSTDSSVIYIQFDDTISVNKAIDISAYNGAANTEVVWTDESNLYDSWSDKSHGTLTVTTYDKTNKKLVGTFSGVLYESSGTDSVKVTGGTFNTTYVTQ